MKTNSKTPAIHTHEGAVAKHISPELQLRRSVMSCMLWETEFYENGVSVAKRIEDLIPQVPARVVADIAVEARHKMNLRHVPLQIVKVMAGLPTHKQLVAETLEKVISRADELSEFVALYWKTGRKPLSAQIKKGLAKAFTKFSAYALGKYNRDGAVKLRDVLFLCHAKPKDDAQAADWKALIDGTLTTPDTWEVALSSGANKKETWERLIGFNSLGGLALLRNLRNMEQAQVNPTIIRSAITEMNTARILPFRFIAAARHAPKYEGELEAAMFRNLAEHPRLKGNTVLLVDVSFSMNAKLSGKSDLTRLDAACGLAMLLREICETVEVCTFSNKLAVVPPRRGFALRDAVVGSQPHGGTDLAGAIKYVNAQISDKDRLICISDEQAASRVPDPLGLAYMINVASARNGIGYGAWNHIDGFSEAIVSYLIEAEKSQ